MEILDIQKPFVGMIHLPPLPGSIGYAGEGIQPIIDSALRDLGALEAGGADAVIVENTRDAPFGKVAFKETISVMTVVMQEIVRRARIPVGVNVLRNDALGSLGIAVATEVSFIRVNVFCGAVITDQGLIEGEPRLILGQRKKLGIDVKILADVHVKHAAHLNSIAEATLDTTRNGPDGLIVTGQGTGKRTSPGDLQEVMQSTDLPVFVGSGVRIDNLSTYHDADGFIIGSSLKEENKLENSVEKERVRALAEAIAGLRESEE